MRISDEEIRQQGREFVCAIIDLSEDLELRKDHDRDEVINAIGIANGMMTGLINPCKRHLGDWNLLGVRALYDAKRLVCDYDFVLNLILRLEEAISGSQDFVDRHSLNSSVVWLLDGLDSLLDLVKEEE